MLKAYGDMILRPSEVLHFCPDPISIPHHLIFIIFHIKKELHLNSRIYYTYLKTFHFIFKCYFHWFYFSRLKRIVNVREALLNVKRFRTMQWPTEIWLLIICVAALKTQLLPVLNLYFLYYFIVQSCLDYNYPSLLWVRKL